MNDKNIKQKQKLVDEKLDLLTLEVREFENKWKRALADYQNLEKRIENEKKVLSNFLNASLLEKILVIHDDLVRAEKHLNDSGIKIILSKFESILENEGIKEIKAEGETFDPEAMDCVDLVKGQENKVIEVTQKGYLYHGRVLRPAKVKVGKGGK